MLDGDESLERHGSRAVPLRCSTFIDPASASSQ